MDLVEIRSLYRETEKYADQTITVGGWVRNNRDSKNFGFLNLSDGTFFKMLQVVYHDEMENFDRIAHLNIGAAVIVKGKLVLTPEAKQPLRSRQRRSTWKETPHRTIRFRTSVILWNT